MLRPQGLVNPARVHAYTCPCVSVGMYVPGVALVRIQEKKQNAHHDE